MIRILTNEFYPRTGGIATYGLEMAKALQGLGEKVIVSCPQFSGQTPDFPFELDPYPSRGTQDPDDLLRLGQVLRKYFKEDGNSILFLAEPAPIRALLLHQKFFRLSGKRLWIALFGSEIAQMASNPFWRLLWRGLSSRIERIAVISNFTRELVELHFPEFKGKIVVTHPGLSEGWLESFQNKIPARGPEVRLLTTARLHPRKGQLDVIRAIDRISPDPCRICYTIAGGGHKDRYRRTLENAAEISPHRIALAGELQGEALKQAFREADIFIMASRADPKSIESFGIVYLEAAAAGLPVIAADVGGVREALIPGESAILVPHGNVQKLQDAIETLVGNPGMREKLAKKGKTFAGTFSWKKSAQRLMEG